MKTLKGTINHENQKCDVLYNHTDRFDDIPDELILKVHAVCFWKDKILVVNHPKWKIWGLPGGTRDPGESIEETLIREIKEETNCEVLSYKPLSCQKVTSPANEIHYRLHYICSVQPVDDFKLDPAGAISEIKWINPEDFINYIEKDEIREDIIKRAIDVYNK